MTNALTIASVETALAGRPDPIKIAAELVPALTAAIDKAKTPGDANDLRTMFDMVGTYLKTQLPRATKDRRDFFDRMIPAETGYIEASGKAGALWSGLAPGAGRPKNSAVPPNSPLDHGFSGHRDATRCVRVGELDPEDRRTYYKEMQDNERHATINGVERIWHLLHPGATIPIKGKYRVFYADPPWDYGNTMPDEATQPDTHYKPLADAKLKAMNIAEAAEDDAVLFLWVTSPKLEDCFSVITAWGFEYKASFVWDKVKHNMGHYNSVRHELLLVCVRGSCQPDVHKLYDSVQTIERSGLYSEKPAAFRNIIDAIYPKGKRIELFARKKTAGWEVYGDEVS